MTATVLDGSQTSSRTFTWTVVSVNVAPTLAYVANKTSRIGQFDTLQLVGSDVNGGTLNYSATGLPPGLSINTATGLISGTPSARGTYTVTVAVSDGLLSTSRTFTWLVKRR